MENTVIFKPGDKVKYNNTLNPEWDGWEGTVQSQFGGVTTALTTKPTKYAGHGTEVRLTTANLELVAEPAFTFADIQVGDKIRRTYTRPSGTTEVREGVVTDKGALYATDTDPGKTAAVNYILAYDSDGDPAKPQVVLELLERPEPVKELWEDRKPGEQIASYFKAGGELDRIFTKQESGEWSTLLYSNGKLGKGFLREDKDVADYLTKMGVTAELIKA